MILSPATSRVVRGRLALQVAISDLADAGCWFEVEPEPQDCYRIKVKPGSEHCLPPAKDWEHDASDEDLLECAISALPGEFTDWCTGDAALPRNPEDLKLVQRLGCGFIVMAEVYVDYPENTA